MNLETRQIGKRERIPSGAVWRVLVATGHWLQSVYQACILPAAVASADGMNSESTQWSVRIARVCASSVALIGVVVLLGGWVLDISIIKSVLPGFMEMKANTALCFVLSGVALCATVSTACKSHNKVRSVGAFLIVAIGSATLFEYQSGTNLGIDELLFRDLPDTDSVQWVLPPGRMALVTAVSFVMAGCSLLLLHGRATVIAQLLAYATTLAALVSLATYLWRDVGMTDANAYVSLAPNTVVGFTILGIGLLCAAPSRGPVAILKSPSLSGALARRLLPAAIGVTLALSVLEAAGQRAGWYGAEYGMSLFVLTNSTVLVAVILLVAHRAFLSEMTARESADQIRRLNDVLEQRVEERTQALRLNVAAMEAAANGIVITDLKGTLKWVNPAFTKLTGYSAEEAIGKNTQFLKSGKQAPEFYKQMWNTISDGQVWHGELSNRRKDGSFYEEEMTITPVRDGAGSIAHFVAIKQDITERKRAEEELQLAKKSADDASRAKSEFLANMSHEIRTPMNGIIGLTGLALDTELNDEQRQYLDGVMLSAESLLEIINSILDFSKIEAGKVVLERIDFDLRETMGNIVKPFLLRAREKRLSFLCDVRPDVPNTLIGDPGRLWQVLNNLIGNALKFTQQGEVTILVECHEALKDSVTLHFAVRDTGVGIPANKQRELFQPFTQVDSSTTRKYGGTGLGLVISANLVGLMGGRIWFESAEGHGSQFHFTARFHRQLVPVDSVTTPGNANNTTTPQSTVTQPESDKPVGRPLRILVAEDNALNQLLAKRTLEKAGHSVAVANNGEEAVAAVRRETFDLVMMDVQMPILDGFQATARIRQQEHEGGRHLPIVAMTAHALKGDRERCLEAGMDGYVSKPIRNSELFSAIEAAVDDTHTPQTRDVGWVESSRPTTSEMNGGSR